MNLQTLHNEVLSWFEPRCLTGLLGQDGRTHRLAMEWLARSGKRWRPFLAAGVFQAIRNDSSRALPRDFRRIALAVECFHKASLIHDDIEDKDRFRYGLKTLHEQYGVPIALNVGDLLLGLGYHMIATCRASARCKSDMLLAASRGHCELCAGQGLELCWSASPAPLSVRRVLDTFRRKTAPAFDVALSLGAIYAGADGRVAAILRRFSGALGVAYQIRDDLEDLRDPARVRGDDHVARPSVLLAIAHQQARPGERPAIEALWCGRSRGSSAPAAKANPLAKLLRCPRLARLDIPGQAMAMLQQHARRAVRALDGLRNPGLEALLQQVVGWMLPEEVPSDIPSR